MSHSSKYRTTIVVIILSIHVILLAYSAKQHSPTFNEIGHLPAGLSHLQHSVFEIYRVNPPFPRIVAATALFFQEHKTDWKQHDISDTSRAEILVGIAFAKINDLQTFELYTLGRWFCIPFSVLGGLCCYWWARDLFGWSAGLFALMLWCFSPSILGHGSLIMPDVPAAATGILSSYVFWRWMNRPNWPNTLLSGFLLGIAELTKFTLLVFYLIYPVLWTVSRFRSNSKQPTTWYHDAGRLVVMFLFSIYLINLCYHFQGSFQKLREFTFISNTLTGSQDEEHHVSGNAFKESLWGEVPVPLPKDYLLGLDRQKADFDYLRWSYLNGDWKLGGWWYFYLFAFLIKTPLGILIIYLTSAALFCFNARYRLSLLDELCLMLPIIVIVTLVSSQTAFSMHPRYIIPVLPFLFVWSSRVALAFHLHNIRTAALVTVSLVWAIMSSLYYFPHSLSYYNELTGGPEKGAEFMIDSPTAWGQDLLFLKNWYDEHPEARPLHIANFGWVDPVAAGIEYALPPLAPLESVKELSERTIDYGPRPGWYVIDVNHLKGTYWDAPMGDGRWRHFTIDYDHKQADFTYFAKFEPIDRIAYSYLVYHITLDQANQIRNELGLPEIKNDH